MMETGTYPPNPPTAVPGPPTVRASLIAAGGPAGACAYPSYSRRWCFHAFAPSLPPPAAPQGNLPRHCSAPQWPNLAACRAPSLAAAGPSPPYPSWRANAAPHPTPDASPAPQQPWVSREPGGATVVLPRCFPWLPAGGLAAEGGCWGLQQAGGGQACAHAAGTTARPVTQGHLSPSC